MDILRHASDIWNDLDKVVHDCWKKRAARVNSRPLYGQFENLPRELGNTVEVMTNTVQYSMINAWKRTCKILRSAMIRAASRNLSEKKYIFNK